MSHEVIRVGRYQGKTEEAIRRTAEEGGVLMVATEREEQYAIARAKELGLTIQTIRLDQLRRRREVQGEH